MKLKCADLFCGAGGTSTGLIEACHESGITVELTAINHWNIAVATHTANHPGARHLCANLDTINPRELYGEGELDLLWASPECMHHSIARGGHNSSGAANAGENGHVRPDASVQLLRQRLETLDAPRP